MTRRCNDLQGVVGERVISCKKTPFMMNRFYSLCLTACLAMFTLSSSAFSPSYDVEYSVPAAGKKLKKQLKRLGAVELNELSTHGFFEAAFEVVIEHNIDHTDANAGTMQHRFFISHKGYDRPVVFETEGYALRNNRPVELCEFLEANLVQVEYRYFGKSVPEKMDWEHLQSKQAVEDLHLIMELLKEHVYTNNKWLSTGISKGGETALIYKRFYPTDVDATLPYVAPMILAQEDPRTDRWQQEVGEEWCRAKIVAFQRHCLTRYDQLLPMFEHYAKARGLSYPIGPEAALEYAVLEYPFSFWQWGGKTCEEIPDLNASDTVLFEHLKAVASPWYYTQDGIDYLKPHFYQHMTELGYYGYPYRHLQDLLRVVKRPTNQIFAPQDVDLKYNPRFVPEVLSWLDKNGNNIIYVYGEMDTWTACAVTPGKGTNSVRYIAPGGDHSARLRDLKPEDRERAVRLLKTWMGLS